MRLLTCILLLAGLCWGCGGGDDGRGRELRIFHASGLTPVLQAWGDGARKDLGIRLLTEPSGSQAACRKLGELDRDCDIIMVADRSLIKKLLSGRCSWRLDFARDEVVLAVGVRAPHVSAAEEDWASVLTRPEVRIGRVDENQGPIGYRTLLVWKLRERLGSSGLHDALKKKCDKVVDHVTRLIPLLKTGEIDYAFVYRSICVARDVRFIELDDRINLGSGRVDYSRASVAFKGMRGGGVLTVKGAPIVWALSIPDRGADEELAAEFIAYCLGRKAEALKACGFKPLARPRYFGSEAGFARFAAFAERGGELE